MFEPFSLVGQTKQMLETVVDVAQTCKAYLKLQPSGLHRTKSLSMCSNIKLGCPEVSYGCTQKMSNNSKVSNIS